jgi:hypothetical protein
MQALLMALHDFVGNALQQRQAPAATQPPPQAPVPAPTQEVAPSQAGGGLLSHSRGSGFGQAITQGGLRVGFGLPMAPLGIHRTRRIATARYSTASLQSGHYAFALAFR